jgi:uncharacterized protein
MTLFLLTFFLIYGGVHVYVFFKAKAALAFSQASGIALILFMTVMVLAPVIVRISERQGLELPARAMSWVGYLWMGLAFLFFASAVAVDLYRLILFATGFVVRTDLSRLLPSARFSFLVPLALSMVITVYGFFDARDIRTERITIRTGKISPAVGKLTIVQISDVHLGLVVREERLAAILELVKKEKPDILISTGDLVDGQIDDLKKMAGLFQGVKPRYGKFAVTGNHEFYSGINQALMFTRDAGFTVLRGEGLSSGVINIAGVDDPAGESLSLSSPVSEAELLSRLPADRFTLFLKHRPVVGKGVLGLFDLQLSGHTHKGQIFPFWALVKVFYPLIGYHDLGGSILYVSRGTGTWGPPVRFLASPEITVYELVYDSTM